MLSKHLQEIGLCPSSHNSCLFVGSPIPGKPPIYVALYVDDFVYFSADPDVEKHFEKALIKGKSWIYGPSRLLCWYPVRLEMTSRWQC